MNKGYKRSLGFTSFSISLYKNRASQVMLVVKNPPANEGDIKDLGSIPGFGRSPGGGRGNPLQYPSLENPMDRGAWWATVHRGAKSQTWLKRLSVKKNCENKNLENIFKILHMVAYFLFSIYIAWNDWSLRLHLCPLWSKS